MKERSRKDPRFRNKKVLGLSIFFVCVVAAVILSFVVRGSSGKLFDFNKDDVAYIKFGSTDRSLTWKDEESISLCVDLLNSFRYSGFKELDPYRLGGVPFTLSLYCPSGGGYERYSYGFDADWGTVFVTEVGSTQATSTCYFGEENYFEPIKQLAGLG